MKYVNSLEKGNGWNQPTNFDLEVAKELRRLHEVNQELVVALEALLTDVGRTNSMLGAVKARAALAKATKE